MKKNILEKKEDRVRVNITERKNFNKKPIIWILILIILLVGGYFGYKKYLKPRINSQDMSQKEIDKLLSEVGKLIRLPDGVQPAIATINDIDALVKEQKFFLGAKNGDKILIYQDKAILYDPDKKILINVGPVIGGNGDNTNTQQQQIPTDQDNIEKKINLDIRNGSGIAKAASKLAETFDENNYYIIQTIDASKEYDKTILVNLTGKDASALENRLGVKAVDKLPEGEKLSIADFVIIIGK